MRAQESKQERRDGARTHGNVPFIFLEILLLTVSFLYLWRWVNPALIFQYQEPVFFADSNFFKTSIVVPGGLISYLGSFLTQFFVFGWIGSLIMTGCIFLSILLTRKCLNRIVGINANTVFFLIPAILLLFLHSHYAYTLGSTLGFLAALGFFYGYVRLPLRNAGLRILSFGVMSIVLYVLASGAMALFAVFCAALEATRPGGRWSRRLIYGIVYPLWGFAIPYLTVSYLILVRFRDTFSLAFPFGLHEKSGIVVLLLYLFLPVGMILIFAFRSVNIPDRDGRPFQTGLRVVQWFRGGNVFPTQSVFFLLMTAGALFFSFNRDSRTLILVDYYARRGMWNELIGAVERHPMNHELVTFQFNRALYHTGRLVEDMFSFPQRLGPDGLFLSDEFEQKARLQKSDLYFDMGHVNYALRWAHEAMSMRGETAWTLQRIAQIAILNGQYEYAAIGLSRLERTLFNRSWAKSHRKYLGVPSSLEQDLILRSKKFLMPKEDFIMSSTSNTADLKALLKENQQNKMAFEYLMADYLLARQLGDFAANLHYLKELGYSRLPRHFEEAALLYRTMNDTDKSPVDLTGYPIRSVVMNRFNDYFRILQKYQGDKQKAREELWKVHGNTYWYYVMFSKTPQRKDQSE